MTTISIDTEAIPGAVDRPGFVARSPEEPHPVPFGDHPPADWGLFVPRGLDTDSNPYIDDQARVALVAWEYDRCHNGQPNGEPCWTPTPSVTANRMFQQGATVFQTDDDSGLELPTGVLCISGGHAEPDATLFEAQAHYNDPERAGAFGRIAEMVRTASGLWRPAIAGEPPTAAWFLGSLRPGILSGDAEKIRRGVLSGDWRFVPELDTLDSLGPCLVNRGGLVHGLEQAAGQADVDREFWQMVRNGYVVQRDHTGRVISAQAAVRTKGPEMASVEIPQGMTPAQASAVLAGASFDRGCDGSCRTSAHDGHGSNVQAAGSVDVEKLAAAVIDSLGSRFDDQDAVLRQMQAQSLRVPELIG